VHSRQAGEEEPGFVEVIGACFQWDGCAHGLLVGLLVFLGVGVYLSFVDFFPFTLYGPGATKPALAANLTKFSKPGTGSS